jgi:tetratricopeptide (TPR) repeat protein
LGLSQWAGIEEIDVPALTMAEARDIGNAVWSRYHRECNPQVLDAVLGRKDPGGAPACSNPLWLTLAMDQLNLLDADDYTRAGENLLDLLLEEARRLPGEIEGLYAAILARAEKVYGAHWARPFACLLALSRQGWRELDLEGMLPAAARILFGAAGSEPSRDREVDEDAPGRATWRGLPAGRAGIRAGMFSTASSTVGVPPFPWDPLQFAALRRGFRAHILQRGTLGQWDFFHAQVRQAVLRQYLTDPETARRLHSAIADHLLGLPDPDQLRLREAVFHLMGAGDGPRAARFYAHVEPAGEATRTLADALVDGDEVRAAMALTWTASLPTESGLDPDTAWRLSNRLQFGLNDAIKNRAQLAVRFGLLNAARESLVRLVVADPSNSEWQRGLSVSHDRLGDVLSAQGDLGGALAAYREAFAIAQRLAAADPSNSGWQRDLSVSHERLGIVLSAQGDLGGALAAYREALAIRQRLAAADPSNAQWQRDLSVSHGNLGDVLRAQGDLGGALAAYQAQLAIAQRLAAADPSNSGWQRDLSISHNRLGDVLRAQGDLGGALTAHQAQLAIAQRLAAADPSNSGLQWDLSVSHSNLGDVLSAQGDPGGALAAYQAQLAIAQRLAAADPSNSEWQRGLSGSQRVGDVLRAQGDLGGALAAYREALAIAQRLAAADPSNSEWQRDLSVSHERVGDVLRAQGDLGGALAACRQQLAIARRLAVADPSNSEWQRNLWLSYWRMALILEESGAGGALEWGRKAHEILAGMKRRGLFLSPQDEQALAQLTAILAGTGE